MPLLSCSENLRQDFNFLIEYATHLERLGIPYIKVGNKLDKADAELLENLKDKDFVFISASNKTNIQELKERILSHFHFSTVRTGDLLVTNLRHYNSLQ